jgi:PAS domain-containing protein
VRLLNNPLLSNPTVLRMVIASSVLLASCVMGLFLLRRLRHSMLSSASGPLNGTVDEPQPFALHAFHGVIQQLKQQKHELLSEQQAERRRAKTSENISAAMLSHLSNGVLFFTPQGLVRQANPAAKNILGFASLVGMNAETVFRQAVPAAGLGGKLSVATALHASLQKQNATQAMESHYVTPSGVQRMLEITITTVCAPSGDVLGAACLISDRTEMAQIQKQQQLQEEMSAEMALALRTSLATMSAHARQVAKAGDLEQARALATDIISEAAELDHTIGGFLAGARTMAGVAGN